MKTVWGVNLSDKCADRLLATCALTQALSAEGWQDIETAPKDGSDVELRIVHINAAFAESPTSEGWIDHQRGKWIDHNGGGFTWEGLCGVPCQWRPVKN